MSRFELSFNTDNAAFDDDLNQAIGDVLHRIGVDIAERRASFDDPDLEYQEGVILDTNGNIIGLWTYTP